MPSTQNYIDIESKYDSDASRSSLDVNNSPLLGYSEQSASLLARHSYWSIATVFALAHHIFNFIWSFLLLLGTFLPLLDWAPHERSSVEWRETDLEPSPPFIAQTPIKFTSGLYWNESTGNTTYRAWNEDEPVYAGPRTPELDATWDEITLPLDLYIAEEEPEAY
ncbi:hypothetical protein MMC25_002498 [Agyrium rufum]|nr:hypothetical protein [Agyrium rufum]